MNYYTIPPSAKLARYVRFFWVYEGEATEAEPYIYRGYADTCTELVFHFRTAFDLVRPDETHESSIIAGIHAQTRKFTRWVAKRDWSIFGCYIYPFAIPRMFGFPASDLTNDLTDFRSLLGVVGDELEEKIMTARNIAERVAILSAFLERRLDRDLRELPPVFTAINRIIKARGLIDLNTLSSDLCMSHRNFERKFKEFSGFSPKMYSRIARFQSTLNEYGSGRPLTDIAYDHGYYDQSHFINDFRELSGYNPKIYFSGNAEGSEYLDA